MLKKLRNRIVLTNVLTVGVLVLAVAVVVCVLVVRSERKKVNSRLEKAIQIMDSRSLSPWELGGESGFPNGGSGSGKTRFFVKANLLQAHSSYILTDPKGDLVSQTGAFLQRKGYRIKILNTINFSKSMHYNPMAYVHSEKDILKLVTTLITNTKGEGKGGDPFWEKAETLLLTALIGYIHYHMLEEEQNFSILLDMLNAMEVREDDENFKNGIDLLFDELEAESPDDFALRQYKRYKLAAGAAPCGRLPGCRRLRRRKGGIS